MRFKTKKERNLNDRGEIIYDAKVIARKLNGYIVQNESADGETFICSDDIDVVEISEEEKNASIRW